MNPYCRAILIMFAIASVALISACVEKKPSLSGIYKTSHENGIIVPLDEGEECRPPYKQEDSGCIEPYTGQNVMGLLETGNGDLDFALSLDFFNGHSCSIESTAKKDGNGWTYLEQGEGEYKDLFCKLTFAVEGDQIVTHAEGEICRDYCGARGGLDGITFPLSSRTKTEINKKEQLDCVLSQETPCEGEPTREVTE